LYNKKFKEIVKMSQAELDGLIAQLEASKQMYNEALNTSYQLRTENVMLKKQVQTFLANMQKQAEEATKIVEEVVDPDVKLKE
jgi:regulator of replication initiation timing